MTDPFSDTTSKPEVLPPEWEQAKRLAERLGASPDHHPARLLFAAIHRVLDRLEALENPKDEPNRG
jgi:nitrogen-specific signal transduction histidine kinase